MPVEYGGAAARSSVPVSTGGSYRGTRVLAQALGAMSPTVEGRVGSGYGERTSSRTGRVTFHAGWDFVAARGTPIYAADHGRVVMVAHERPGGPMRGYGNAVVVRHPDDTYALYAHLSRIDVEDGDPVGAGQQIGLAGNTTNGAFPRMPPHLHFEVRHPKPDGSRPFPGPYGRYNLDPLDWFRQRGLEVTNRWGRPPGTLAPGGGEVSGLGSVPEWWETTFPPERAPRGQGYRPGTDPQRSALWDWSGLIAGTILFNGVYFLAKGELPIIRPSRRRR